MKRFILILIPIALLLIPRAATAKPISVTEPLPNEPLVIQMEYGPTAVMPIPKPKPVVASKTSLLANGRIEVAELMTFLQTKRSPLAAHAEQILESRFWSTIIGICSIEQYGCSRAPYNNYWGLMKVGGGLQRFATLSDGIAAIDAYLERRYAQGRDTFEEFRGYYCVNESYAGNICPGWEAHVKAVKAQIENL